MTQPTLRQRLRGLLATLVLLLIVAGVPFLLIAIGATTWHTGLGELRAMISGPDDGTLAMVVIGAVAWIAWAFVAVSVVLEVIYQIRGLPAPKVPGLAAPQRAIGRLVAVAALLFTAAPTGIAPFSVASAHATPAAQIVQTSPVMPVEVAPERAASPRRAAPVQAVESTEQTTSTIEYTVKRGDSLWKIADRLLGDGARFTEIVDLNSALLNGRPDFITPGTVLKVPHKTSDSGSEQPAETYVVKAGDTLSEIAEATLGDPMRYPELFEASRTTVQPDGARLIDPDLIRPGWNITIPDQPAHVSEPHEDPAAADTSTTREEPVEPRSETAGPLLPPSDLTDASESEPDSAVTEPTDVQAEAAPETDSTEQASAPGWLLPGLSGAGAVLAALTLLAIRAHHNTQLRYRRPGQSITPPPEDLRAVEKTAFVSGAPLTATITLLNQALNHLSGECTDKGLPRPQVVTATLTKDTVTLHLADDADLPEPWTGAGRQWSRHLDLALPDRDDMLAPYPMLVTIGRDDSGLHLINLEHLGIVALTGDMERATALARHIATELALNPWSTLVEVTLIGFGEELAKLDDLRLHHHPDGEQILPSLTHEISRTVEIGWGDPDPYRVILTTSAGTNEIAPLLASGSPRVGASLVTLSGPVPESTQILVDHTGQLSAPVLGLNVHAAGLSREEAAACAALVDLTRDSEPVKIVPFEGPVTGWRALADQAGALHQELTDPRGPGPAGDASLLPNATKDYTDTAATTAQDVETLAPVVPAQVRQTVEEADPNLDEDLAAWLDPTDRRPRLTLLGAVNARAFGELKPAITKRKPYFVEILAYLALHPKGATANEIADAFGIAASRARTDVGTLRNWLGTNPQTMQPYLPPANESRAFLESGVRTYQLDDVLVDLDLFRRLRMRGQARGSDGVEDLKSAMALVTGPPFGMLREKGWSWLLDTERIHETTSCAIVDTAHILVTSALATSDLGLARQVAEAACAAAPYDDICRLDLIKVAEAEGRGDAADAMLDVDIFNRTDDYLPPVEPSDRTIEIVGNQDWVDARRHRREHRAQQTKGTR